MPDGSHVPPTQPSFASTGIEGLDDVMTGGFAVNHVYLVEGQPGVSVGCDNLQGEASKACQKQAQMNRDKAEAAIQDDRERSGSAGSGRR